MSASIRNAARTTATDAPRPTPDAQAPETDAPRPISGAERARLAERLARVVGADAVIADAETQRVYESDALPGYAGMPLLVVLPGTVEELREVMRVCNGARVPVIARGAATGLSGGAVPRPDAVVVSTARFTRILEIDPLARTARVEPGVRNLAISEAAAPHGLFYGPDPSSQIACSIGGNVAENSGGVHCLKYGLTVHNVIGADVVDVTGELMTIGSAGLDGPGFDLLALMHGSEGLLGIVTAVTVRLLPVPEEAQVVLGAFAGVRQAGDAVAAVIAAGIVPAGLEMMDGPAIRAAEDYAQAGYPTDAEALLLCELDGSAAEVAEETERVAAILAEHGGRTRVSRDAAERARFWKGRKSAFPALGRIGPDYYCMDGTIPRGKLADVLTEIARLTSEAGLRVANVFHAGDGNLHPLIMFDANAPGDFERTERLGGQVLELCVTAGGCITGEHGVGLEKLKQMPAQFTDAELAQFHAIKAAFDPDGRLNPGKGVPTLRQCQEYRALSAPR